MKIVINTCWGGFGLSAAGEEEYLRRSGKEYNETYFSYLDMGDDTFRADSTLVAMVEADSSIYGSSHAQLKVVEIPDGVEWQIVDYDGQEHVAERHRVWS